MTTSSAPPPSERAARRRADAVHQPARRAVDLPTGTADYSARPSKNVALFGQGTLNVANRFRLIGGLRYTIDQLDVFQARDDAGGAGASNPQFRPGRDAIQLVAPACRRRTATRRRRQRRAVQRARRPAQSVGQGGRAVRRHRRTRPPMPPTRAATRGRRSTCSTICTATGTNTHRARDVGRLRDRAEEHAAGRQADAQPRRLLRQVSQFPGEQPGRRRQASSITRFTNAGDGFDPRRRDSTCV